MALTLWRRPLVATSGVCPRSPHVRPSTWSERTPASSRKKIFAPACVARARKRGNTVVVQRLIATGSRSYARRNGFCGVMSNSASRRPTAVTPTRTPNFCAISAATICRVHSPKSKPYWRLAIDPATDLELLARRQGGLPARMFACGERGRAAPPLGGQPLVDRRATQSVALDHLAGGRPFLHAPDGQPADRFRGLVRQRPPINAHASSYHDSIYLCRLNKGLVSNVPHMVASFACVLAQLGEAGEAISRIREGEK